MWVTIILTVLGVLTLIATVGVAVYG
jgi:hypothetical protein